MNLDEFHGHMYKSSTKHFADGSYMPKNWDFFPLLGPACYFTRQYANHRPQTATSSAIGALGTLGLFAVNAGYAAVLNKLMGFY